MPLVTWAIGQLPQSSLVMGSVSYAPFGVTPLHLYECSMTWLVGCSEVLCDFLFRFPWQYWERLFRGWQEGFARSCRIYVLCAVPQCHFPSLSNHSLFLHSPASFRTVFLKNIFWKYWRHQMSKSTPCMWHTLQIQFPHPLGNTRNPNDRSQHNLLQGLCFATHRHSELRTGFYLQQPHTQAHPWPTLGMLSRAGVLSS